MTHRPQSRTLLRAVPILGLALLLGAIASLQSSTPAEAQTDGFVRVSPSTQTVPAGGNVLVHIIVEDVPNFGAYEFHLQYDESVLDFLSVTGEDAFLESTGRDALCFGPEPDDLAESIVSFGCISTGVNDGPSGDGTLVTLVFSTSCAGTSPLQFVDLAADVQAVSISSELGARYDGVSAVGGVLHTTGAEPCTPPANVGDASCDDSVNAIDAALILQFVAGLLTSIPCADNADSNQNAVIDAIDAALVLQFVAGLVANLPP